jgi:HAD superfamily hydrolase (TIGR01509 family)
MTKWIIFDAMGVVFEEGDDILHRLVPFLHQRGSALNAETVHAAYRSASRGEISSREFWNSLGLGGEYPAIEDEYLDTCLRLDSHFMETAERLGGKFSLALFSNDIKEWSAHLRRKHGLDRIFQTAVISGEVGIRKPAPEIYRILLERLKAEGKDCLLIDDRPENLLPAAALGITPIWLSKEERKPVDGIPYRISDLSELPPLVEKIFANPRFTSNKS